MPHNLIQDLFQLYLLVLWIHKIDRTQSDMINAVLQNAQFLCEIN